MAISLEKNYTIRCERFESCGSTSVIYVLDRSGSFWSGETKAFMRKEMTSTLSQLAANDQFGIIIFDTQVIQFPVADQPLNTTSENIEAGIKLFDSTSAGSGTCTGKALILALMLANHSTTDRKVIILITDGFTTCPGIDANEYARRILEEVAQLNTQRVEINAITAGEEVVESFTKALAAQNNGVYEHLP